ncbi:MAG: DinB family protein [Chitinophagaceae bacterium]|nr:DinB family protein [Chitinophagaceae bacterium]
MERDYSYTNQLAAAVRMVNPVLSFDKAFEFIPYDKVSIRPAGLPYSIWELATHIRIAQHNYLQMAESANFTPLKWPDEFWPKANNPSEAEWNQCINDIHRDRESLAYLISEKKDVLTVPLTYANGQSTLDLILKAARHNSYHTGEVVVLRRLLGIWP